MSYESLPSNLPISILSHLCLACTAIFRVTFFFFQSAEPIIRRFFYSDIQKVRKGREDLQIKLFASDPKRSVAMKHVLYASQLNQFNALFDYLQKQGTQTVSRRKRQLRSKNFLYYE
jgi:hypothetical protein